MQPKLLSWHGMCEGRDTQMIHFNLIQQTLKKI